MRDVCDQWFGNGRCNCKKQPQKFRLLEKREALARSLHFLIQFHRPLCLSFPLPFPLWPSLLRPWLPSGIWWNNNRTSGEDSWWAGASFPMRYDAVERLELLDKRQVGQEKETLWNGPPRSSGPFLELFKVLRINFSLSNDLLNQIDSSRNRISVFNLQGILFFLNLLENGILYFIRNIYFALYSFSKITTPRNCITFDSESFERVNSFSNRTNHEECSAPSISLVPSPTVSVHCPERPTTPWLSTLLRSCFYKTRRLVWERRAGAALIVARERNTLKDPSPPGRASGTLIL